MKQKSMIIFTTLLVAGLLFAFGTEKPAPVKMATGPFEIPENINSIFEKSCYGCHNSESRNEKARGKLKIDELTTLKKTKLIAKLNKIAKEVGEGEMPPEKFAAKYPDRVPTAEEKQTLIDWAKGAVSDLTGK